MMDLELQIICENFNQQKIIDNKIIIAEENEEYYIIPLTKSYSVDSDDDLFVLFFKDQQLWLKTSNRHGVINLKDNTYDECVIIKSDLIYEIYVKIYTTNYIRKGVWHSQYNVSMNKQYLGKHCLIIPIIEDMVKIHEYGEGIVNYEIEVITNEIVLKEVLSKNNGHGYVGVTANMLLNKDALFVMLNDDEILRYTQKS